MNFPYEIMVKTLMEKQDQSVSLIRGEDGIGIHIGSYIGREVVLTDQK